MSKNLHENSHTSWISCIYNMLQFLNISPHYILQGNVNVKKRLIKTLTSIYRNVWKSELFFKDIRKDSNQKNKLPTLRQFKSSFYFESYLESLPYSDRNIFTKFRIGVHSLEI
jgi:hypothetical protein